MKNKIVSYMLSKSDMYEISRSCDKSFDGIFYMGVITTKIYCLPSCKARTPLYKNVLFFDDKHSAIDYGLRGCKRCRSEFFPNTQPLWLNKLLDMMNNMSNKLDKNTMEEITGVNISTIRRYFQSYLNITAFAYHRKIRLKHARKLILEGESILDIPYITGFESLSGFRSAFQQEFGINPGEMKHQEHTK